jgi:uncharacterized damage-inducible protein DinB
MSTSTLLTSLFQYKAWANEELFGCLSGLNDEAQASGRHAAILILNHAYIVDSIFAANLQRKQHGYTAAKTKDPPPLGELFSAARKMHLWYVDFVSGLSSEERSESIAFAFTDGAQGRMSREEMLAHVITHGTYHRGEVGRIIAQLSIARPHDVFTRYLHDVQPSRREKSPALAR